MAEPPEGGEIVAILDISSAYHPPTSDTYALNFETQAEIPLNVSNCLYKFRSLVGPMYTLKITTTVGGTTNPLPGEYSHPASSTVQVRATANANYFFDHWELDTVNVGSTNPYTVLMDANHTLKAVFVPITVEGTKIFVDPPEIFDPTMLPGSTFNINISVNNVADLKTCEFNLTYNSLIISWTSMSALKVQNRTPTVKIIIDDTAAFIWVKLQYPTAISALTPTPLVTIVFIVNTLGSTPLDLHDTHLLNSEGQPIEHVTIDGFFSTLIRDVAITDITVSRNWAYQGWKVDINVTAKNKGNITETFTVQAFYDGNSIGNITITDLLPDNETTVIFTWDTTNVTSCINYTISAQASTVPYELNTADNQLTDGKIKVRIMGDINGDGKVDIQDIFTAAKAYGSYPSMPKWDPDLDLTQDLKIDIKDIFIIAKNYGKSCS